MCRKGISWLENGDQLLFWSSMIVQRDDEVLRIWSIFFKSKKSDLLIFVKTGQIKGKNKTKMWNMNLALSSLFLIAQRIFESECTNYESFEVEEGECSKEEQGINVKSTTECLLHCGMAKCMNSMIKNQICYCTEEDCMAQRKDEQGVYDATFFLSKLKSSFEDLVDLHRINLKGGKTK